MKNQNTSLFQKDLVNEALKQAFVKLNPKIMFRNPVMFTVEIGTVVMLVVSIWTLMGEKSQGSFAYNFTVFLSTFSDTYFLPISQKELPKQEEKRRPTVLRKTREETPAKLVIENKPGFSVSTRQVMSASMKKGDVFICEAGDNIATDGEIIEGLGND